MIDDGGVMELAQDKHRQGGEGFVIGLSRQVGGDGHFGDVELQAAAHPAEGANDGADFKMLELQAWRGDAAVFEGFGMGIRSNGSLEDGRFGRSSHGRSS